MTHDKYVKAKLSLIIQQTADGNMLIPKENAQFYILAIDKRRRFMKAKAWLLKHILSLCESLLAR